MASIVDIKTELRRIQLFTLYDRNSTTEFDWCKIKYIGPPAMRPGDELCQAIFANRVDETAYAATNCAGKSFSDALETND